MSELLLSLGLSTKIAFYISAVFGSGAVELAALLRDVTANKGQLPDKYRTRAYPIVRIMFAFLAAGPLAILLSAASDWNAFYVGVTAPLIFDRAAAGIQPNGA